MDCKYPYARRRLALVAGKPDQTSFATNMHFTVSDKSMSISREIPEKKIGECKHKCMIIKQFGLY
jgi:hypothetical protein